jgi:hypothetical protein
MTMRLVLLLADVNRLVEGAGGARAHSGGMSSWLGPRNSVFLVLLLALVLGGGRKLLQALQGRRAAERLGDPAASPAEIEEAAQHGRAALVELFGLLDPKVDRPRRLAAGRALARLWAEDQLIAEEEKALAARGYEVAWRARRRYPRRMRRPIPIEVRFGLPFLDEGTGVRRKDLAWSYRVAGSERASLEQFSPPSPGSGRLVFALDPSDFPTDGPHRLDFEARVRTAGLTSDWELELPHMPFTFEFDPLLDPDSLLTLPDEERAAGFARGVFLGAATEGPPSRFIPLGAALAWRDPPALVVNDPQADLAHRLRLEFEGVEARLEAAPVVVARDRLDGPSPRAAIELSPISTLDLDRPGTYRVRAVLSPDADLGWADPDVRSLWPGEIVTPWVETRLVRP